MAVVFVDELGCASGLADAESRGRNIALVCADGSSGRLLQATRRRDGLDGMVNTAYTIQSTHLLTVCLLAPPSTVRWRWRWGEWSAACVVGVVCVGACVLRA